MKTIENYDPPMGCPTGLRGAEMDPALVTFAVLLTDLSQKGAQVERYNLAQQPSGRSFFCPEAPSPPDFAQLPAMNTTSEHPPAGSLEREAESKFSQKPPPGRSWSGPSGLWHRRTAVIATLSIVAILLHLLLRFGLHTTPVTYQIPLLATLVLGGLPPLYDLLRKLLKREFGSDLLGGISIVTSVLLGEYLAGSIIVLMLAGGEALERYALRSASSALAALAKRVPSIAHRKRESAIVDVALQEVAVGDTLVIYPHDSCPVDGVVIEGHGVMDESYLTGEPFQITKTSGWTVISGAIQLPEATEVGEQPGQGLHGTVSGHLVQIASRSKLIAQNVAGADQLPPVCGGLECVVSIDQRYAATLRFRDAPRAESLSFVKHLGLKHQFQRVMIVSGDRESEVRYLAEEVGITEIHAQKNPEEKLAIVLAETAVAKTLYVGDGINDAPAMMAATVGMAIGQNSDVTAEAAGVVVMDNSLNKVDEFMHISRRMRIIAVQSAVGGMALSVIGMVFAATGYLSPVSGAISQEVIDVVAVLNALRAAFPPRVIHDL